jgi:hypothetical protein
MVVAAGLAAATSAAAQSGGGYDLEWSVLDCGATTPSTGNHYVLLSSIGRAASGSAAGGGYALQGGWPVTTDAPVPDVTDGSGPLVFRLHGNTPNPFATTTAIAFSLPRETPVRLRIYDLAGRRVRNVLDRPMGPGRHQVIWDGRDDSGRQAAHGIYLLRLEAGELRAHRKLAFVP